MVAVALLAGATVQSLVGLGLGLVAAPVITMVEPRLMPELMLWLACTYPLVTLAGEREDIHWIGLGWSLPTRVVGTAVGALLGWVLALNVTRVVQGIERAFGIQFLDASVYLMSDLPSEVRIGDVLQVAAVALLLAAAATIYPAWRAARTLPAEALRHE